MQEHEVITFRTPPGKKGAPRALGAEYQRFLIWFCGRVLLKYLVEISTQRLPSFLWPSSLRSHEPHPSVAFAA